MSDFNNEETDLSIILKRIQLEAKMVDLLRIKAMALEAVLKKCVPNFEIEYASALILAEHELSEFQCQAEIEA